MACRGSGSIRLFVGKEGWEFGKEGERRWKDERMGGDGGEGSKHIYFYD